MHLKWTLELITLDLKYTWAISRNSTNQKTNAFIRVSDGKFIGNGEAAPNVRYQESPDILQQAFDKLVFEDFTGVKSFNLWLEKQILPNALRFGIESAYITYLAKSQKCSVCSVLGLREPIGRNTSYTIPIMPEADLKDYIAEYNLKRFRFIKIKVNKENLVSFTSEIRRHLNNSFIIDANEAYTNPDNFLLDMKILHDNNIEFVEQPFPSGFSDEYRYLKKLSSYPIFADESITDTADFGELSQSFHGVNIKLMKAGSFQNGIRLLKEAKNEGLRTMIGCMVESGLAISSAYYLSSLADYLDLDSFMLLKQDPYPMINEKDGILSLQGTANHTEFS